MLKDREPVATVAVRDLETAKPFYRDLLGLDLVNEDSEVLSFRAGGRSLFVYRSDFAGTNHATAVTWEVGDQVDDIVRQLAERGVTFEHYDLPMLTLEGDVHAADGFKIAWFKDPDGNIHSVAGT